jgi:hypothetical protein
LMLAACEGPPGPKVPLDRKESKERRA